MHVLAALAMVIAVLASMLSAIRFLPEPWSWAITLALAPLLAFLWDAGLSGRPFTLLKAPGGFWGNLCNEISISVLRLGEASIFGMRPGIFWGQVGAVGGGAVIDESFKSGADLSGANNQYRWVEITADNTVNKANAAADKGVGILQNKPANGATAWVRIAGRSKVDSDAALTANDLIGPSADGQSDAKVPGTDTTEFVCGIVVRGSSAAGEMAEAIIGTAPGRGA